MTLTMEQIIEQTSQWPPEKLGELVGRLSENLHGSSPGVEGAWKAEVDKRILEIESGAVEGIPVEESLARIRKIAGL